MNKKNIQKRILEKIEREDITPKSRIHFILRRSLVWFFATVSLLIGSVSVSVIILGLVNHKYIQGGAISLMPFVWFTVLILFALVTYHNYKHTKEGYRHGFWLVFFSSVILSFVLGIVLFASNIGGMVDKSFQNVPYYQSVGEQMESFWSEPEDGFLGGNILKIDSMNHFSLKDFDNKIWEIESSSFNKEYPEMLSKMESVRIIGEKTDELKFEACLILPLFVEGEMLDRHSRIQNRFLRKEIDFNFMKKNIDLKEMDRLILQSERNLKLLRNNLCSDDQTTE